MNDTNPANNTQDNDYDIAVRQFQQQILPGGHLESRSTGVRTTSRRRRSGATVRTPIQCQTPPASAEGRGSAPAPNSQFNYPAYTVENTVGT